MKRVAVFGSSSFGQPISDREERWRLYVGSIANGRADSLASLYDESASSLYGLALRMMRNQEDAEEVLLEVFEQVWRTAPSFSAERGTVWRWLTVLVRSRAVDRMRTAAARRDQNRLSLSDEWGLISLDPQPDSVTILNQERLMIQSALQLLPGEQRQALEMAYFAGLTHVEIASELGVPLGTVKTRIRAAMDKLRISLSQRGLVVASESTR